MSERGCGRRIFCVYFMGYLHSQDKPTYCIFNGWASLLHLLSSAFLLFSPSRNGTQLQIICKDYSYDFNLQETRDLPHPAVIKPVGT